MIWYVVTRDNVIELDKWDPPVFCQMLYSAMHFQPYHGMIHDLHIPECHHNAPGEPFVTASASMMPAQATRNISKESASIIYSNDVILCYEQYLFLYG